LQQQRTTASCNDNDNGKCSDNDNGKCNNKDNGKVRLQDNGKCDCNTWQCNCTVVAGETRGGQAGFSTALRE
jgi:hypothetical protein